METKREGFAGRVLERIGRGDPRLVEAALQQLLTQRQLLEVIFENLQEGLIVTDPHLRVVVCNPRARRWLRIPDGRRYSGESLLTLIKIPEIFEFIAETDFSNPKTIERDFRFARPTDLSLHLTTYPVRGSDEVFTSIVFVLRDVTAARRAELQQRQAERIASLATLTAGIAHELKNPLNSLQIHAQLANKMISAVRGEGKPVDLDKMEGSLSAVLEETKRITRIVDDFLVAVRPTNPQREEILLRVILDETVNSFRSECDEKAIELRVRSDSDLPPILLDSAQIARAFAGIIRNAIEAVEERRRNAAPDEDSDLRDSISIDCRIDHDDAVVEFIDTGCGIEKENLGKVFEPYFTTKFSGSGLGLMNVYRIVREHEGETTIDSEHGKGSRVRVRLPLAQRPVRLLPKEPVEPIAEVDALMADKEPGLTPFQQDTPNRTNKTGHTE